MTNTTTAQNTATFTRYDRRANMASVDFTFPNSTICPKTHRWYSYTDLMVAARENDWMAPVFEAAKAAGLRY